MPHGETSRPHALAAALLGLLILLGSLVLVAIPVASLWLLSQLGQPYMAIYVLALGGCPIMMIAWGLLLLRANRLYARLGEGDDQLGQMLEVSIALSVVVAIAILMAWFLVFPHGGGPVQGPWPG